MLFKAFLGRLLQHHFFFINRIWLYGFKYNHAIRKNFKDKFRNKWVKTNSVCCKSVKTFSVMESVIWKECWSDDCCGCVRVFIGMTLWFRLKYVNNFRWIAIEFGLNVQGPQWMNPADCGVTCLLVSVSCSLSFSLTFCMLKNNKSSIFVSVEKAFATQFRPSQNTKAFHRITESVLGSAKSSVN